VRRLRVEEVASVMKKVSLVADQSSRHTAEQREH